jgi:hypothetical protein
MPEFDPEELRRQVRAVVDGERGFRLIERIVVAHQEAGVSDETLLKARWISSSVGERTSRPPT